MEAMIIKEIIAAIITGIVLYIGFINKMRSQIAVLEDKVAKLEEQCKEIHKKFDDITHHYAVIEEKVKRIEQRQDSHSKKNDEIITLIADFKLEMVKKFGDVSTQMAKISSDVENINETIAVFDNGIVSDSSGKKKKKKN